jgi:hypothetical protein
MARTAWAKLTSKQKVDALAAIKNYVKYWQLKETDMEFIPHASSFLNQERFYDELDMTVKSERPKLPWYSSDQLTMEHGQKLGIAARPGESMQQYRARLASVWSPLSA